jgi:hypothetical protein
MVWSLGFFFFKPAVEARSGLLRTPYTLHIARMKKADFGKYFPSDLLQADVPNFVHIWILVPHKNLHNVITS